MRAAVALMALVLALTGCSTFNYEWRREARKPTPTNSIAGRWQGHWISEVNGHNGALLCLIIPEGDDRYRARFRATYDGWLKYSYTAQLHAQPSTNGVAFSGSANLGKLLGVYEYVGHASPTNFRSTYRCRYDHGTFDMARPTNACP